MSIRNKHARGSPLAMGLLAVPVLLAACTEGQFGQPGAQPTESTSIKLVEQEVEKPGVFQATARGLWDGRPSLGGLWVAHVDTGQPERVIMVNIATGAEVKGALFRRERGNPGPPFQLSSSAAAALGILAGVPSEIRVTAIRRETIEVVTSQPATEAAPAAEDRAPEGSTLEPITASEILAVPLAPPVPKPRPVEAPKPVAAAAPVETKAPEVDETPIPAEDPAPAPAAEPAPDTTPESTAVFPEGTAIPSKPYVQVATLSTTQSADTLVARLEKAGMSASYKSSGSGDAMLYIVIVGPAATQNKARENLGKVRGMGFKDAFPSRGL